MHTVAQSKACVARGRATVSNALRRVDSASDTPQSAVFWRPGSRESVLEVRNMGLETCTPDSAQ